MICQRLMNLLFRRLPLGWLLALPACLVFGATLKAQQPADIILHNGKIL